MKDQECEEKILDAAKKFLNGHPPSWKLFRGTDSYTAEDVIKKLERDADFRKWFVENVLSLSTELFLRGKK